MSMSQYHWMGHIVSTFAGPQMGREDSGFSVSSCLQQLADRAEEQVSLDQNLAS